MIIFRKVKALREYLDKQRKTGNAIGFIPTMGALHEGHLSLINQARTQVAFTVVSIFVNPTQFNDSADFNNYPITLEPDIQMLLKAEAGAVFLPSVQEIYPNGTDGTVRYELGDIETRLEGKFRPGHFQGVAQVMDRLLTIVGPCRLFMGQKDFQQCMVVNKLISLKAWNNQVHLHVSPTLREPSGLAMSSRNKRLDPAQILQATAIFRALQYIKDNYQQVSPAELKRLVFVDLERQGFRPDYVSIANAGTLEEVENGIEGPAVALIAAFLGKVRLIDNLVLDGQDT